MKNTAIKSLNELFSYILICTYIIFLYLIPYDMVKDRTEYERFVLISSDYLSNLTLLDFLFKEPIFYLLLDFLSIFLSPLHIVYTIYFFVSISFLLIIKKYSYNAFMLFLGLTILISSSVVLSIQIVALRQALSIVILIFCLRVFNSPKSIICVLFFCSLIHISFYILLVMYVLYVFCRNKFKFKITTLSYIIIISSILLGVFSLYIAFILNIKQDADYFRNEMHAGGGFFLFSLFYLIFILFYRDTFNVSNNLLDITVIGLSIFLGMYYFTPFISRMGGQFMFLSILILVSSFSYKNIILLAFSSIVMFYITYIRGDVESYIYVTSETIIKSISQSIVSIF
ncbi:EpsG family protein [Providencia alcalifaciens]|uniref:EpsG family protein n=1 Tax=Providencia huashanensis TaxID=3037798 RepID=UPI0034601A3F